MPMPAPLLLGSVLLALAGLALLGGALASSRRGVLAARLGELRRSYGSASPAKRSLRGLPIRMLEAVSGGLTGLRLMNARQQEKLKFKLQRAGIRRPDGAMLLMAAKLLSAGGLAVLAVLVAELGRFLPHIWLAPAVVVMAVGLFGSLLPEMILSRWAQARQVRITQRLPDALDLLIIFATAGYGIDTAVQRLARELKRGAPDLADELAVTSDELRMLSDRNQALMNLAERTGIPAARSLVMTLAQSQKYGTPLSQALRVLAVELRNDRISQMEERAGRVPVLITLPMIALILPAVMIVVLTPGIIKASRSWSGQQALSSTVGHAR
jgi:tight adherence protein C